MAMNVQWRKAMVSVRSILPADCLLTDIRYR